ncbi:MAG: VanZ family protein [Desulfobacterales bacterium]|nr:VanZ family protein [Desulfobacterales bacterium]
MGILLIFLAGGIFFYNRGKFLRFILMTGGSIAAASLFYRIIPNPYELTHLPQYAILSILMVRAIKPGKGICVQPTGGHYSPVLRLRRTERSEAKFLYYRSAAMTGALGAMDELYQGLLPARYFNWYDILLNGLGGVLGLVIVWGISKE